MRHPLIKVIFDYADKRLLRHALDTYDWDKLSETQQANVALEVLRYINDLETLGNGG